MNSQNEFGITIRNDTITLPYTLMRESHSEIVGNQPVAVTLCTYEARSLGDAVDGCRFKNPDPGLCETPFFDGWGGINAVLPMSDEIIEPFRNHPELKYCTLLTFSKICVPKFCLLYTSPSPRDRTRSRMPSSA